MRLTRLDPRGKLYLAIVEQIERLIGSGELAPGARLDSERDLAVQLGVSRSVVREAITALVARGLVEVRQGDGAFVRAGQGDAALHVEVEAAGAAANLLEVRAMIEPPAARLAAARATPDDLARLDAIVARMERELAAGELSEDSDVRFHMAVAAAAGNPVLTELMASLQVALRRNLRTEWRSLRLGAESGAVLVDQHRAIAGAIRASDQDRAAALVRQHLDMMEREHRRRANEGRR
jgi:GntR family transcriptional regulator, transcriptional repressor for pyruvate dehydrogenase complex